MWTRKQDCKVSIFIDIPFLQTDNFGNFYHFLKALVTKFSPTL